MAKFLYPLNLKWLKKGSGRRMRKKNGLLRKLCRMGKMVEEIMGRRRRIGYDFKCCSCHDPFSNFKEERVLKFKDEEEKLTGLPVCGY